MRKLIVLSFISMDGVMQAPGGPEEDTSNGFKYGGWTVPYFDDSAGEIMAEQTSGEYELLLGKFTYDIFASYWPHHDDVPIGKDFNRVRKYVAADEPFTPEWNNSVLIEGDVAEAVKKLKEEDGPDLQVHGSGNFIQTLLKNDLVDELWLKVFPITLGPGKKLFAEGTIPAAFELTSSKVTPTGVIVANYKRAGEVKTGTFAD